MVFLVGRLILIMEVALSKYGVNFIAKLICIANQISTHNIKYKMFLSSNKLDTYRNIWLVQKACNDARHKDMGQVGRPLSSCAGSDQRTTCPLFIAANYYAPTQTLTDYRHRRARPRKNSSFKYLPESNRKYIPIPIYSTFCCATSDFQCHHNINLIFLEAFIIS